MTKFPQALCFLLLIIFFVSDDMITTKVNAKTCREFKANSFRCDSQDECVVICTHVQAEGGVCKNNSCWCKLCEKI
ncbi:hypothetical protein AQUCO_01800241v1 [Aquilegia coerulea]|uniref:Knottin scorpion toxin-like domain-containing protein n=1 Tax=Aquilegia coerulea TaxID=218851 RepID=A0A2G5DKK1_AQUCA|nr:hypothetical protein AQUCO_01800241v1 [Aquilegia coerulea]